MVEELKKFVRICQGQKGITGLETAIILIAFVVVAAVFAYTALSAGLFSTQKSQEAVYSGLEETQSTLELKGGVVAHGLGEIDDCESAWTAGDDANVTTSADGNTYIEGSHSAKLSIADGFSSGVVAYTDVTPNGGSWNLSNCSSVSFWIKTSSALTLNDGDLQLFLSESDTGSSQDETLDIPSSALDASWHKVTVSLSGTTSNYDAVKSVGLYANEDPGAVDIYLDIIETQPVLNTTDPMKAYANQLVFTVANVLGGEPIDFSTTTDADDDGILSDESSKSHKVIISYSDEYQQVTDLAWTKTAIGKDDDDNLLEDDEKFQITVDLSYINNHAGSDSEKLGTNRTFTIEVKPPKGAVLTIERTMPAKIKTINQLD